MLSTLTVQLYSSTLTVQYSRICALGRAHTVQIALTQKYHTYILREIWKQQIERDKRQETQRKKIITRPNRTQIVTEGSLFFAHSRGSKQSTPQSNQTPHSAKHQTHL